jgi:hypothetical protein
LASQDCIQYPEATHSGDVVEDAMNLEIHLLKRFLHVQNMLCCHLDQTAAVSPERADSTDEPRRTETGTQQTHRMEVLKPLAVGDVGFPAGNILYVLRIDEAHL